jgi:hypothetical protein
MSVLDFITQDELDDLDEDPSRAFMSIVTLAQRRLGDQTKGYDSENQLEWEARQELRYSFMNFVVAAGKRLEIEPFASMQVPRHKDFADPDYRQFQADLDHYITQLLIDNGIRTKKDSVQILPKTKDKIRQYIYALRDCIENADLIEAKREILLDKLKNFESELEKRRLNILAVARLSFELLAIPGALWASGEVTHRLITQVMQTVAEARVAEQETRQLAPVEAPKALSAPRSLQASQPLKAPRGLQASPNEIDDDIPF